MTIHSLFRIILVAACGVSLHAQSTAVSQITGVAQDASGAGIPNAEIRVTQTQNGLTREVTAGPDGSFTFPNLPVGPYRLEAKAPGFSTYVQTGIVLQVASNPVINPVLQVSSVSNQVEVTANAAMAETHENSISQVIDQKRIEDLPLNGRNPTQLILLSGGSAAPPTGGDLNTSKNYQTQSTPIAVAGGQISSINFLMDGGDNNNSFTNLNMPFPFPDALQEFNVQTSAVPARYGLHPGGVVNLVTRAGGNQFHGDLFEFLRNGIFNARNFFGTSRDSLKRNQFGGTLGGPILHDKLFFFTGYQGTRARSDPATTTSVIPNQGMVSGDFSTFLSSTCLARPITLNAPFVNNKIPTSQLNPQALALAKYLPSATADPCGKVTYGIQSNGDEDQLIARIDWNGSEKHQLFGRYFYSDYRNPPIFDGQNALTTTKPGVADRSQTITLGDNYSFRPNLLSAFHATATRLAVTRGSASNLFSPADVGININDLVSNFVTININNGFSLGCGTCAPGHFNTNSFQVAEDIDWIHGSHQISFGVNWIHDQLNAVSNNLSNGTFTFNGSVTGNSLADFLIGRPSDFMQSNPQQENERYYYFGAYVQDAWRVNPRVSVNLGLRWEPYFPEHDSFNRGSHFEPGWFAQGLHTSQYANAPVGVVFPGDPQFPGANTNKRWNDLAPRAGLIFDPKGDGRQTIRLSYGILYDTPIVYYDVRFTSAPPWGNSIDIPNPAGGLTNPYLNFPGGNPFPQPFPPPKSVIFPAGGVWVNLPLHIRPPYMQQWNLSYQRQFGANWLVTANYLGNKTTHLWLGTEINPAVYIQGQSTTANTNQRRVLYLQNPAQGQYYSTIGMADDGANAHYNGLLISAQHRLAQNFTALANYTWSHCMGDGDFNNDLTGPIYQNPSNRAGDKANCNFDHRHIANISLVAMTPQFSSTWTRRILGAWELSGVFTAQSGGYWSATTGRDASFTGVNLDRPNVVGDWRVSNPAPSLWFNPGAFTPNLPGQYGNAGRNVILGPGYMELDMGLLKNISITEHQHVEFRAEAFNILNHANFATQSGGWHGSLADTRVGQITQAADPRILQFALKYVF